MGSSDKYSRVLVDGLKRAFDDLVFLHRRAFSEQYNVLADSTELGSNKSPILYMYTQ